MSDRERIGEVAVEVCIDSCDPAIVARFWSAMLGYQIGSDPDGRWVNLQPPPGGGPVLNIQRVPERKQGKNRLHLDLHVSSPKAGITKSEQLGATTVRLHGDRLTGSR